MRALLVFPLLTVAAYGQQVISLKSGLIHYVEGRVLLAGEPVEMKVSKFPQMTDGQVLATEEGRAEVLLTPGVVLRAAENSSFKLVQGKASDTRIEALSGSILVEAAEFSDANPVQTHSAITLLYKDASVTLAKKGLYRIDADSGALLVYDGEAKVSLGTQTATAKKGVRMELGGAVLASSKFDPKDGDAMFRWASRRASYLAMANVSAAKRLRDSGAYWDGGWMFNPWFGMYTYIPRGGVCMSPFGWRFYSPARVIVVYQQPVYYGGVSGYDRGSIGGGSYYDASVGYNVSSRGGVQATYGGSNTGSSAPAASSSGSSAGSARTGGDAGARGSSNAGRGN